MVTMVTLRLQVGLIYFFIIIIIIFFLVPGGIIRNYVCLVFNFLIKFEAKLNIGFAL